MPYTVQLDFRAGLDRRRPQSAAPAGSLWECINAHITRGGDIEKRKSFVSKYALPTGNTFGLARAGTTLYTFGSKASPGTIPTGITYQRLAHPDGADMSALLSWDAYNGKVYAVAQYIDGQVFHFYDGNRVTDWDNGIVRATMSNNDGIAAHLASLIQADTTYATTVLGSVITIQAAVAGTAFTIAAETTNGGSVADQTAVVAAVTPNVAGVSETLATCSFQITGGTASAGVNKLSSIKINGIEVLNTAVDWTTSNSGTATLVAAQINTYNSTPEYTATASGQTVTISAAAGSGATPNGFTVLIQPAGNVTVDSGSGGAAVTKSMSGGISAVSGVAQKNTVTIGGTFEAGDTFTITIDGKKFGHKFNPDAKATIIRTHKTKVYGCASSILQFSGTGTATGWNTDSTSDGDVGAGFINMSTQDGGADTLTGLEVFQKNLAVFSRRVVQTWNMDSNPSNNVQLQVIKRTGSRAQRSIISYGDSDVAYLSDSGIRSLKSREISNLVGIGDIGTPIDTYVQDYLKTLSDTSISNACAAVEPIDGRLWMGVGQRIFVYSYFPASKIAAWSDYELGMNCDWLVELNDRIYMRSADTVYLYGGDSNATYDSAQVTVTMPYFSDGKLASYKELRGFDADLVGTWDVDVLVDPRDSNRISRIGTLEGFTYLDGRIAIPATTTHAATRFISNSSGYARISNFAVHFNKAGQETG